MNWLAALWKATVEALLGWGQKQAEKPKEMKDANTPKDVRDNLGDAVDDWMRDKDQRSH